MLAEPLPTVSRRPPRAERGYSLVELMVAITITLLVMVGVYGMMLQNQSIYEQQTSLADVQQTARVALDLMTRDIRMAGADPAQRAFAIPTPCQNGTYKPPTDQAAPAEDDVAPLTVAETARIRVKMDRPQWTLGPEPTNTPTPTPSSPAAKEDDCCPDGTADGDYDDDDEDGLGDGFINDAGEDVEYAYDAATDHINRIVRRINPACGANAGQAPTTQTQTIAANVTAFALKYYDSDAPAAPCPAPGYLEATYEEGRDACDPPLVSPFNLSAVRRVRMRFEVETERVDAVNPRSGKKRMLFTSEATLRNRNQ